MVTPVPLSWLGDILIAARKERGFTQQALGERLGLHQAAIARMEQEKYRATSLERITRIADALGLSLHIITDAENNPQAEPTENLVD